MARIGRPGLSYLEKQLLQKRWKSGEFNKRHRTSVAQKPGSIHGVLTLRGGIAPLERKRAQLTLTLVDCEDISRGIAACCSIQEIASKIGKASSTVSRELNRNGGADKYRAIEAAERAWNASRRPKKFRLATNRGL